MSNNQICEYYMKVCYRAKKTDSNAVIPLSLCSAQVGREKSQFEVSLISTD